ncbi:nhl-1 [Symbiodinium natans]|uniref:Nhl-1 protein n=1 Tax=Symbiodinium natans TaxID=878477 RepID=A0A812UUD0_9DINO|nr:nhl-1 [Symbiodinium natans]
MATWQVEAFHAQQQEAYEVRRAALASTMLTRWRAIDFLEKVLARGTNCEVLLLTGYISAQRLLGEDVLASKVAELALCAALRPKQLPVKWSGDVAAAAQEISQMAAAIAKGPKLKVEMEEPKERVEESSGPERIASTPYCADDEEPRRIFLVDAVKRDLPRPISLYQALEPKPVEASPKVLIRRLGGATVQSSSDKEIRQSGLGELRAVLGLEGDDLGCFRSPCGMAVDSTRLFVADTLNHRIQVFNKFSLEALGALRLPAGAAVSSLSDPSGMCCLEAHGVTTLVVVEYTLDRLLKIELGPELGLPSARSVNELAPGTFYGPFGAGISQGRIIVADSCNHRCLVLTLGGQVLFEFGGRGQGPGQFEYPECVATFRDGFVAVSDKDNHRVQVFSDGGAFQHFIPNNWVALPGPVQTVQAGALSGPMGMCVDAQDRLFVCDCGSDRVQIFSRSGEFLQPSLEMTILAYLASSAGAVPKRR